ncbi:MAG TPA: hypothetical protein ENK66_03875 [Arcobacter sp.]|nr:hypothetical protein [Arcobacter sp.]
MNKFYSINIQNDFATVLLVHKKKGKFIILEDSVLEIDELTSYLKEKIDLFIVVEVEDTIDQDVVIPSVIKQQNAIRAYIFKKIKDSLDSQDIFFKFHVLSQNKETDTTLYSVDGVYIPQYTEKLEYINNWSDIKSTTISKFALYDLSKKCFDYKKFGGYFFVFSYANVVTVLAIDKEGTLLLKRSNAINAAPEMRYMQMVEEVNQTINYTKQQFRDVQFSVVMLSGSMTLDDVIAEHIFVSNNIPVSVIYPNTLLEGLSNEEPQNYITSIAAFFVAKKDQFLPDKLLNMREYKLATNILLLVASFLLVVGIYNSLDSYMNYSNTIEKYNNIKSRLVRMTQKTQQYSYDTLQKTYNHLEVAENFLSYNPIDISLKLKPLIVLIKPSDFSFAYEVGHKPKFKVVFEKKFSTLEALYISEKSFFKNYKLLNIDNSFELEKLTDYQNLLFKVVIFNTPEVEEVNPEEVPGGRNI